MKKTPPKRVKLRILGRFCKIEKFRQKNGRFCHLNIPPQEGIIFQPRKKEKKKFQLVKPGAQLSIFKQIHIWVCSELITMDIYFYRIATFCTVPKTSTRQVQPWENCFLFMEQLMIMSTCNIAWSLQKNWSKKEFCLSSRFVSFRKIKLPSGVLQSFKLFD